jgi:hypothetical protein
MGAGLLIMLIGLAGIYFGKDLTMGTAARMGPGYFPRLLSWLILAIGAFIGMRALLVDGPPIVPPKYRAMIFCLISCVMFGYAMYYVGLFITGSVMIIVAAYARPNVNILETVLFAVGMSLFTVVVFVYGLGQPLPAWWGNY